jgi:quercetin dioxygenase-like cupin family protein
MLPASSVSGAEGAMNAILKRGLLAAVAASLLGGCADNAPSPQAPALFEAPITKQAQDAAIQWGPCPEIFPAGCEIAVLRGDPAQANADVFLRVPGGYRIPAHSHTSAERMILVSGELDVRYRGAEAATLSAGEYAYGPAGLAHQAECRSTEACTLFIAFVGPVDAVAFAGSLE